MSFAIVVYIFGSLEGLKLVHQIQFHQPVVCSLVEVILGVIILSVLTLLIALRVVERIVLVQNPVVCVKT